MALFDSQFSRSLFFLFQFLRHNSAMLLILKLIFKNLHLFNFHLLYNRSFTLTHVATLFTFTYLQALLIIMVYD